MNKIFFIDTVTTGMNPERCAIYRIGGIYTEDAVEKSRFEFRMRPFMNARISEQSLWICGESRASLLVYNDESEVFKTFIGYISNYVDLKNPRDKAYLAGFNSSAFDVPFLRNWFFRNGNERFRDYFHVQTIDMMTLSAFALMGERGGMPDFHLETAARHIGVRSHATDEYDCITNAKTCLDMYRKLQERFGITQCLDTSESNDVRKNF